MKINVTREADPDEQRCALDPGAVRRLVKLGAEVTIESNAGLSAGIPDAAFTEAGARIESNRNDLVQTAEALLQVGRPSTEDIQLLKPGSIYLAFTDHFNDTA